MSNEPTPPLHLIAPFRNLLTHYDVLRAQLYAALEPHLALTALVHDQTRFTPTERTITRQLKHWPEGQFIYPPVAWVAPRKGRIEVQGAMWSYYFHGAGLTFAHASSLLDVSVEFARTGDAAITEWTFRCYLESLDSAPANAAEMLPFLDLLFPYTVAQQIIRPVPPILDGDEQTYVLLPSSTQTPDERQPPNTRM
jgi:uncharacterized protein DUF6896